MARSDATLRPDKPVTWLEMLDRLTNDADYPASRRANDISRLRKSLVWSAAPTWHAARSPVQKQSVFAERPFNRQTIMELFDGLRPAELKLTNKTVSNARSACKRIADHYKVPRGIGHAPLSHNCRRLLSLVPSKWDRRSLRPALHYLSYYGISPWDLTQSIVDKICTALVSEFRLAEPRTTFVEFTRTWNKCTALPGWPPLVLSRDVSDRRASIDWSEYPELRTAIDVYLARGCSNHRNGRDALPDLDIEGISASVIRPLAQPTVAGNRGSLSMAIWALRESNVTPNELVALADLCRPERYRLVMLKLLSRAGNVYNRTVMTRADALFRLARQPSVLTEPELAQVQSMHRRIEAKHSEFLRTLEDRDQQMLDQLDDPSVMDALLSLPTRIKNGVLARRNRLTIGCAYAIQRALILELWLCAPYRVKAFVSIELEQIVSMHLDDAETVLLRGPKQQASNKKSPEHFLNDDTITLLKLYLADYRPLILAHNKSPDTTHLLPGRNGGSKHITSLREQMTKLVRKHTSLKEWHPHLVRKISPKITLDADPGALEIARRTGGWTNEAMLRQVYGQRVHRASQSRYIELLESRRLTSLRAMHGKKARKKQG